jgi:uncharacterized protein (DUF779 family)
MNKELIKEWINDLRSGKYKQSVGCLMNENGYCCLGVACETYKRLTGKGEWVKEGLINSFTIYGIDDTYTEDKHVALLPNVVRGFFGFSETNPRLCNGNQCTTCNDAKHFDFNKIADLIEDTFINEKPILSFPSPVPFESESSM